ncbi:hypothetical protein BS78_10G072100 [Paspalum vaginatum]|nr:hypothetical protein BS78_10G072100 [Paspalum vaginatum]
MRSPSPLKINSCWGDASSKLLELAESLWGDAGGLQLHCYRDKRRFVSSARNQLFCLKRADPVPCTLGTPVCLLLGFHFVRHIRILFELLRHSQTAIPFYYSSILILKFLKRRIV